MSQPTIVSKAVGTNGAKIPLGMLVSISVMIKLK